jgi:hypothetical protein
MAPQRRAVAASSRSARNVRRTQSACCISSGLPRASSTGRATAAVWSGGRALPMICDPSPRTELRRDPHETRTSRAVVCESGRRRSPGAYGSRRGAHATAPHVRPSHPRNRAISIRPAVHATLRQLPANGTIARRAADVRATLRLRPVPRAVEHTAFRVIEPRLASTPPQKTSSTRPRAVTGPSLFS